ncbi:MAG: restriction endonuclease subunit S [Betaproteobacteria bacterium]|nr:restriction endonuclease subunit S [Betaproteobacteria bacterium]
MEGRRGEIRPLGDVAPLNYGKALKATDRKEGKVPVYGSSGIVGTHSTALAECGAIVVGRKGNVGSLFFSPVPCFPIDTVFYILPEQASYRLFLALHQLNFISSDAAAGPE